MPYGMMTTLLLFVLSSGYYWDGGIIGSLVGRILLFKAKLLLGPPIALGAFVVGQGSGLLIGKLIGISYIVNKWIKLKRVSNQHRVTHYQFGLNRPFYYHKHPVPSYHYDWNRFPNIPFNQYNQKPYGTYAYDTSTYPYNAPYQYYPGATGSQHYTPSYPHNGYQYNGFGTDLYASSTPQTIHDTPYAAGSYAYAPEHQSNLHTEGYENNESGDAGWYEVSETDVQDGGHGLFQESDSKYETESSEEEPTWEGTDAEVKVKRKRKPSEDDSATSPAEQFVIDHFLKSTNEEPGMSEEKKLDILADLLRGQFHDEFLSAADAGNLKSTSEVTTKSPLPVTTKPPPVKKVKFRNPKNPGKPKKKVSTKNSEKKNKEPATLDSPLVDVLTKMDGGDMVPESVMKWFLDGYRNVDTISDEAEFQLHASRRRKRAAHEPNDDLINLETDKVTASFIQDIKNLFSIVSFLDINRCLEKMICEIHSRGSSASGATEYEKNIVTAFRIMDKIMPLDVAEVDSTTKYRQAAHVGQNSITNGNSEACHKMFAVCGFSSQQIIQLGDVGVPPRGIRGSDVGSADIEASKPFAAFRNAEDMDANSGA